MESFLVQYLRDIFKGPGCRLPIPRHDGPNYVGLGFRVGPTRPEIILGKSHTSPEPMQQDLEKCAGTDCARTFALLSDQKLGFSECFGFRALRPGV